MIISRRRSGFVCQSQYDPFTSAEAVAFQNVGTEIPLDLKKNPTRLGIKCTILPSVLLMMTLILSPPPSNPFG